MSGRGRVNRAGTSSAPSYQNDTTAYLLRSLDLTGYTNATLTFWSKIPGIESSYDFAGVFIDNFQLWSRDTVQTAWTQVTLSLDQYVGSPHTLKFQFTSDNTVTYEGWYLDDIVVSTQRIGCSRPPASLDQS